MNTAPLANLAWTLAASAAYATFGTGCTLELDPYQAAVVDEAPRPELLEFAPGQAGRVYSQADDDDQGKAGIQVPLTVYVNDLQNDLWLDDLTLTDDAGSTWNTRVERGFNGRRQARFHDVTLRASPAGLNTRLWAMGIADDPSSKVVVEVRARSQAPVDGCTEFSLGGVDIVVDDSQATVGLAVQASTSLCLQISGSLYIEETQLDALQDLNALVHVDGDVVISANPTLTNLENLSSLGFIGGDLIITDNPALATWEQALALRDRIGANNIHGDVIILGNGPG